MHNIVFSLFLALFLSFSIPASYGSLINERLSYETLSEEDRCLKTFTNEKDNKVSTSRTSDTSSIVLQKPTKELVSSSSNDKRSIDSIFMEYQQKLNTLALKCDELEMPLEAKITRSFIYPIDSELFWIPLLPEHKALKSLPDDATKNQRFWYSALQKLKMQYSDELFNCALRFAEKKRGYDVVTCVLTTLFVNPDHVQARRFFGYTLKEGKWLNKWQLRQLEKGLVETSKFGWLPKSDVQRYEQGERLYKNHWVSYQEEHEKIVASSSGWRVETEHFSILSRVSLERGVEVGRFLENYYQSWSRLFYRFIATEKQWNSRIYADDEIVSKRHKIILYRNREEYLRELKKYDANVTQSVGGYFPRLRCLFAYEPDDDETFDLLPLLSHEATHQLFEECSTLSTSRARIDFESRASVGNFWATEGIAVYAETFSLNKAHTFATLGGYKDVFRIQCALESLFEEKDYIPLRQYAALSREEFQSRRDVSLLYTQAAGLTFFFMHYNNGVYRDAFVSYLYNIYIGSDHRDDLEQVTGKSFEELDQEYYDFMKGFYFHR